MKKLLYLSFCLVLALAFGCAITQYSVITDNDQNDSPKAGGAPTNTNGKAHLRESSQVAFGYDDGTDELFSFVDQKANGDRTISTYNNHSGNAGQPVFHSDLYCNPDWAGCAVWTSADLESDPRPDFDGTANTNCLGFRSLSVLLSSSRYYGECGRARLSFEDRLALLGEGALRNKFGRIGLLYNLNAGNFSIQLDNNQGVVTNLAMRGNAEFWMAGDNSNVAFMDLSNPLLGTVGRAYAGYLAEYGAEQTTATLCYSSICADFDIAGNSGASTPARVMANMNLHY